MLRTSATASSSTSSNRSTPDALTSVYLRCLLLEQGFLLGAAAAGLLEALLLDGELVWHSCTSLSFCSVRVAGRAGWPCASDAQAAAGLVDEVDGLVGQEAVGEYRWARSPATRAWSVMVTRRRPRTGRGFLEDLDRVGQRGSSTLTGSKRRSRAASFSTYLRSRRSWWPRWSRSPRASVGLRIEAASMAPSAARPRRAGAISSMNSRSTPRVLISSATFFRRSSKSPRSREPATRAPEIERLQLLCCAACRARRCYDHLGQALDDGRLADAGSPISTG